MGEAISGFGRHEERWVEDLRGIWDFAFLGDVEPDRVRIRRIVFNDRMAVPGCFDATPRYAGRRGLAAYRTSVPLLTPGRRRLVLDGVHHWGRVLLNGRKLADHAGGFTQFAVNVPDDFRGHGELVVLVDNRFDYQRCPLHLDYMDWRQNGGIARGAELHNLGSLWIEGLRVVTTDYARREVLVAIDWVSLGEPGAAGPHAADLTISLDGRPVRAESVRLRKGAGRIERALRLPGASLWSPEKPNLHSLRVNLRTDSDEDGVAERIGIRQVQIDGRQIRINGKRLRLLGVNRHEMHPQFGHAQPEQLLVSDVQLIKNLGANFVRGSHYPQDRRFLDLCDQTGICVWCEAIGWQNTEEHLTDPHFIAAQKTHIAEMIAAAANHPSVILWGLQNESHSHRPRARRGYKTLIQHIRKLDPSRPVTYASNHWRDDRCLDLVDVVSINTYPGWYQGSLEELPDRFDEIFDRLDSLKHVQDKPMILSEIGAEGLWGFRDWNQDRWSEEYQARLLEAAIRHLFIKRRRVMGLAIWLFSDSRSTEAMPKALTRARSFNNKGIVDEYRRPKLAYDTVRRLFHELKGRNPPR